MANGLARLVAFSSTSALTKSDASDPGERQLAQRLTEGEAQVRSLAPELESTILRPTMIYGADGDANIERIAAQLRRFRAFPVVARGRGLRQPVHAGDLGEAAAAALFTDRTRGRTYTVAGGEVLTVRDMVARVASANSATVRFIPVPLKPTSTLLRGLSMVPGFRKVPPGALERMARDLVFDNEAAASDFGYRPRGFEPPLYATGR
jgi:uncharacterized protein YbjT (DUF2867 family)